MSEPIIFSGSIVAIVSPMDGDGGIDWDALARLVDWHVESGTSGIVAVGTTGESPTLDFKEHRHIWEFPKLGVPFLGVLIIRTPLFKVPYLDILFSETPICKV